MTVWNLYNEMDRMRREFDQVFNALNSTPTRTPWRTAFLPGISARRYPMINLYEDRDHYTVEALAPGIDPSHIDLSITGNILTLSGEKSNVQGDIKPESYHRSERAAGRFVRTVELPSEVNAEQVEAEYHNGILSVRIPKSEKAKPKAIQVKVAS